MKVQNIGIAAVGALTLVGATLTLSRSSVAQDDLRPAQGAAGPRNFQGGPPPGQGQPPMPPGGQGQRFGGPGGFPGGGMGGGGTAMDSDNTFLYVVQGNMIFKISKADLRIIGSTPLMQGGGDRQILRPLDRPGGQAGGPPPPAAK